MVGWHHQFNGHKFEKAPGIGYGQGMPGWMDCKLEKGQLCIALQGERDGHDYIPMAMEKGAAAVLCSRPCGDVPAIIVEDPRIALGEIARGECSRIGMKVIGVTGSVGKSTTKEMIACVLEGSYRVAKTPANHNNDIGMPMAILAMPKDIQVAVLEMGMNHFREIAYLSNIAKPDVAVIINVGTMHIEHLGSREGILQAKMEILEGMKPNGICIFNGDDDMLWSRRKDLTERACYFGCDNSRCQICADQITTDGGRIRFRVETDSTAFPVELNVEGKHYVLDALAAVSVGLKFGIAPDLIQKRLYDFHNMAGRQEVFVKNGYTIIQDCYNAGPESMTAALEVLGAREGRHVAVLGDMLELGARTQAEHYRVGRIAAEKTQLLLTYGPNGSRVISGAITGGMPESRAMSFEDSGKLVTTLKLLTKPGDVILFKGSRGMRMELILEAFLAEET